MEERRKHHHHYHRRAILATARITTTQRQKIISLHLRPHAECVSEGRVPSGTPPPIPLLSTHCSTFDSPNIGDVHPTNLKTGNFHWVHRKKQYGFIEYRRWHPPI